MNTIITCCFSSVNLANSKSSTKYRYPYSKIDSSVVVSSWTDKDNAQDAAKNYQERTPLSASLETVEVNEIPLDEPVAFEGHDVKVHFDAVYDVNKHGKNIDKYGTSIEFVNKCWVKDSGSYNPMVRVEGSVITVEGHVDEYFARKDIIKAIKKHFPKDAS